MPVRDLLVSYGFLALVAGCGSHGTGAVRADASAASPDSGVPAGPISCTDIDYFAVANGASVSIAAFASCGTAAAEYRYSYLDASDAWQVIADYSPSATYTWDASSLPAGTYHVKVDVRPAGSADDSQASEDNRVPVGVAAAGCTRLHHRTTLATGDPAVGVFFVAGTGECGSATATYRFRTLAPGSATWVVAQDYSASPELAWFPSSSVAGNYRFEVNVRASGSAQDYEASANIGFTLAGAPPLVVVAGELGGPGGVGGPPPVTGYCPIAECDQVASHVAAACQNGCLSLEDPLLAVGCNASCLETLALSTSLCKSSASTDLDCGECGVACAVGAACCGGGCIDATSDPTNCAACGNVCPASAAYCVDGTCAAACTPPPGLPVALCFNPGTNTCWTADLKNDPQNCGTCGVACSEPNPFCVNGVCAAVCHQGTCPEMTARGLGCVENDTMSDGANCGACGQICPSDNPLCTSGQCGPCPLGYCSAPGPRCTLVNETIDPLNCGACGTVCSVTSAAYCVDGMCSGCAPGLCPLNPLLGGGGIVKCTPVDVLTDPSNCGYCENQCPLNQYCADGTCTTCPINTGTTTAQICLASSGACVLVNLQTDPSNCGACGAACPDATPYCSGGGCSACPACPDGSAQCGTDCTCTNIASDPNNCGACGWSCGGLECANGACGGDDAGVDDGGGDDGGDGGGGPGSPPVPTPPGGASGSSWGDPHLVTFDRLDYDFQAAGEFIVLTDGNGFTIQARQVPLGDPSIARVCTNRAVAAAIAGDVVAIYLDGASPLYINHVPTAVSPSMFLPHGGSVSFHNGQYLITWPSGDALAVRVTPYALNLFPVLAPISRTLSGLWGNDDGNPNNDIATRSGSVLTNPRFSDLYPAYADSWRIAQSESLFDYAPGQNTSTFTIESFPPAPALSSSLSPSAYATAYAVCNGAGITAPGLLDACILDYSITADPDTVAAASAASTPTLYLSLAGYQDDFETSLAGTGVSGVSAAWSGATASTIGVTPGSAAIPATHYLGPLTNQSVTLSLTGVPSHNSLAVAFDVYAVGPWPGGAGATGQLTFGLSGAEPLETTTFSNVAALQSFPYLAGNGLTSAGSSSISVNELGFASDSVYHLQYTFDHDASAVALAFAVSSLPSSASWGIDNIDVFFNTTAGVTSSTDATGFEEFHGPPGDPASVGCADGTREAFLNVSAYPNIAGCAATWAGGISMRAAATGVACGDGLGACAAPADACGSGWHVCGTSGAVSELRRLTADECAFGGEGQFFGAISHCAAQTATCAYDLTPTASYDCYDSGFCSESVCCGTACTGAGVCAGGVWAGWTHIANAGDPCGAFLAKTEGNGVLCCQ